MSREEEVPVARSHVQQDRYLPKANINRIMKHVIPENGKIAKDSKELMQECTSEFISFITNEANERCHSLKRKTINGEDILWAMETLGFGHYLEHLRLYLQKYREGSTKDSREIAFDMRLLQPNPHDMEPVVPTEDRADRTSESEPREFPSNSSFFPDQ